MVLKKLKLHCFRLRLFISNLYSRIRKKYGFLNSAFPLPDKLLRLYFLLVIIKTGYIYNQNNTIYGNQLGITVDISIYF